MTDTKGRFILLTSYYECKEQFNLFKQILKRNLTKDEEYLIKNAYLNGVLEGKRLAKIQLEELMDSL